MRRFLLDVDDDEEEAISAYVEIFQDMAIEWLKAKKALEGALSIMSDKLFNLDMEDDESCLFVTRVPDNLIPYVNDLSEYDYIELPEDIEVDTSELDKASVRCRNICVDVNGIEWEGRTGYGLKSTIETYILPWHIIEEIAQEQPPKNNDGRKYCWWCGAKTQTIPLFITIVDRCVKCGR